MPRTPRIEYEGAVYHVLSRGQRREPIVFDDDDRRIFFDTMAEACERTGWRLHAWVLLGNHYHWLLETPEPNLVAGMQWFQTTYSTRFRLRRGLSGHVFQGRYKAIVIEPDSNTYFQTVSSYIHLNPARAKGVVRKDESLRAFPWSSYPYYLCPPKRRPAYLVVDRVLGNLGLADGRTGRRRYAEYMTERFEEVRSGRRRKENEEEWESVRRGWCLGGQPFRDEMLDRIDELKGSRSRSSLGGDAVRDHDERAARELIDQALQVLRVNAADLPQLKKTDPRKRVVAWWVRSQSTMSNRWVAEALHMGHEMNASASVRLVREAKTNELARMRRKLAENA